MLTNVGNTFYVLTDWQAQLQRIVAIDLDHAARGMWREVVAETEDCLCDAYCYGGRLVCHYLHHASSRLRVHELDGSFIRDIELPALSAVAGSPLDHEGIEGRPDATSSISGSSPSRNPARSSSTISRAARHGCCNPPARRSSPACSSQNSSS